MPEVSVKASKPQLLTVDRNNTRYRRVSIAEMQKVADAADISVLFFQLVLIFGPFWVIFGPFWQFWVIFGPIWAILGHFWGLFWVILGHFWAIYWC